MSVLEKYVSKSWLVTIRETCDEQTNPTNPFHQLCDGGRLVPEAIPLLDSELSLLHVSQGKMESVLCFLWLTLLIHTHLYTNRVSQGEVEGHSVVDRRDGVSNLSLFSKHAERSLFLLCMEQMVSHPIVCDELPPIPSPLLPFSKDSSTPHEASTSRRCFLPSRRPVVVVSEGSREEEAVIRTSMVARLCGSFMCRKW